MKYMSKILNYRIILQASLPAVTLAGGQMIAPAQAGIYVKFEDGMLNVEDQKVIELLKNHKEFNTEFWPIDGEQSSLAQYSRPAGSGLEPEHDITTIEFGHVGKAGNPRPAQKLTPEMTKFISETSAKMATEMLHKLMADGKLVYNDQQPKTDSDQEAAKQPTTNPAAREKATAPVPAEITAPAPVEDESMAPMVVEESEPEPGIELKPRATGKAKK